MQGSHNALYTPETTEAVMWRSSVNKKALDQYVNFTEQREELVARHEENRKGEGKIRDLIQTLDLRKDEAVERTFKVCRTRCFWTLAAVHAVQQPQNLVSCQLCSIECTCWDAEMLARQHASCAPKSIGNGL